MSKYHVNDNGEAGKCRATIIRCPFGGDAQHYSTPEIARLSYELSNASKQIPKTSKKESKRSRERNQSSAEPVKASTVRKTVTRSNYNHEEFEGLAYDQVVFDREKRIADAKAEIKNESPKISRSQLEANAKSRVDSEYAAWNRRARSTPVKNGEKKVPIRLVPKGTQIVGSDGKTVVGVVDDPVKRKDDAEPVGVYRGKNGALQFVDGNSPVNVGVLPPKDYTISINGSSGPSWLWVDADYDARKLERNREKLNNP